MAINPANLGLTLGLCGAQSVEKSQRWILSAMQAHGPALVTTLWRILGSQEDVCDVYQETFLRLAHLPDHRRPDNLRAYVFRTAVNIAVSLLRRRQLEKKYQQEVSVSNHPAANDPAGFLDAVQLQSQLREAVSRLPEYMGDVIVLRDLAEMPYAEVARILGITSTAARVYRHKAIRLLSQWMSNPDRKGDV
jgi:RNA polymerase sigma-70 factor (ECF subfamily)